MPSPVSAESQEQEEVEQGCQLESGLSPAHAPPHDAAPRSPWLVTPMLRGRQLICPGPEVSQQHYSQPIHRLLHAGQSCTFQPRAAPGLLQIHNRVSWWLMQAGTAFSDWGLDIIELYTHCSACSVQSTASTRMPSPRKLASQPLTLLAPKALPASHSCTAGS